MSLMSLLVVLRNLRFIRDVFLHFSDLDPGVEFVNLVVGSRVAFDLEVAWLVRSVC